ncbi:hypothetical protein A2U01_0070378, partial [Trifolium medium]|nr:hypothetical protein [Trifolium medium]
MTESDEDIPASETVNTAGTEGATEAQVSKGKEPVGSATATDIFAEKPQEKVVKKKRTMKRRLAKIVVNSESEGTDDDQPLAKRLRKNVEAAKEKAQPSSEQ